MKQLKLLYLIFSMLLTWNVSAEILTVTNTDDSGTGSLRRMVQIANNGDSIVFDKSLAGDTIKLQTDISITNPISISGKNASVIISGGKITGGKSIDNLTFDSSGINNCPLVSGCILKNCTNSAIRSSIDSISVINCTFESNSSSNGGAINSHYSTITGCAFENNSATNAGNGNGGAIYGTSSIITNCTFENNSAEYCGAISLSSSTSTIADCKFEKNFATWGSGAISAGGSFTNCTFENNRTTKSNGGGAISGSGSFTNCTFENNTSAGSGGAISTGSTSTFTDCKFKNNSSNGGAGGAIFAGYFNTILIINRCTFENNTATTLLGGAIFAGSVDSLNYYYITNCTFENNSADRGGAISGIGDVANCTFSNNSANNGGAVYGFGGSINLKGNIFVNNKIMPDDILNDVYNGISMGYNVYTSGQNTVFSQSTDYRFTGTQSLLVPLGDYGGDTQTMPINTSVPNWENIVRRVPISSDRTTDQRGVPLPTTGLACAGSVEMPLGADFTGLNEIKKESVTVYPNPACDIIHFNLDENSEVQLYDTLGKLVKVQSCKIGSNEINISDLAKGAYFLKVNGKSTKIMKK